MSATRWSELRPALKDLLGTRLELRLGEPAESEVDRRRAAAVPARPGHGLAPDGAPLVLAAPRGAADADMAALVARVAGAWSGPAFAPVRLLPSRIDLADLPPGGPGIPLGVDEDRLARVELDPAAEPHLVCFADAESGKTTLLRLVAHGIVGRYTPEQARMIVVDPRRGLLGAVPEAAPDRLRQHPGADGRGGAGAGGVAAQTASRPRGHPAGAAGAQLVAGPEVYLLVDDYDLVAPPGAALHPLLPIVEFLPQAKDVGLHVVVARRCGGAGRALFDPLLGRLRELGAPGLVLNGSPDEGALVETVKASPQPPGRGMLVDRRRGARRVQLAWPGEGPG